MEISYSSYFKKRLSKSPIKIRRKFGEKIKAFMNNSDDPTLKDHSLTGNLAGYRAFSITGDIRVIYEVLGRNAVKLADIGKHSQVY